MADQKAKVVPGIPLAALDAIKDDNVRQVLQALVDTHQVRQGDAGSGDERFVTAKEVGLVGGRSGTGGGGFGRYGGAGGPGGTAAGSKQPIAPGQIARIINDLQAQVMESPLWKHLGERITLIDAPTGTVARLTQEVEDGLAGVNNGITQINTITQTSTSFSARTLYAVKATADNALAGVLAINDVTASSSSASARTLAGVYAAVFNPLNGLYSRALIVDVNTAFADANSAAATRESLIYAAIGTKTRTYYQTFPPAGTATIPLVVGDFWYDSDDNNTSYRWDGSSWVKMMDVRARIDAGISTENAARVNQDNALASAITTIWAQFGGSGAIIQNGSFAVSNVAGAVATQWNQVQAAIKAPDGSYIQSSTIKQTAEAAVTATGEINTRYSVKIDTNGYVTGFGLMQTANNSVPFSEFIVRADRFAIGSVQGPGITPIVPFIVKTYPEYVQGVYAPPGVYMDTAYIVNGSITTAKIGLAQVDTLQINGNAVTVPLVVTLFTTTPGIGWEIYQTVATGSILLDQAGVVYAASTGLISYGTGWRKAASRLLINGGAVSAGGGEEGWLNAAHSGGQYCGAGLVTVELQFAGEDAGVRVQNPSLFIQAAYR